MHAGKDPAEPVFGWDGTGAFDVSVLRSQKPAQTTQRHTLPERQYAVKSPQFVCTFFNKIYVESFITDFRENGAEFW